MESETTTTTIQIKHQIDWNSFFSHVSKNQSFDYNNLEQQLLSYLFDNKNDPRTSGALREEMKVWLIDTVSRLSVDKATSTRKFIDALERDISATGETSSRLFTKQLLLLACQKVPQEIGAFFATNSRILKDFFSLEDVRSDSSAISTKLQRIKNWFSFAFDKNTKGALALEQYLFMYREELWEKLEWFGRRDYTPIVAIQKKYLLMELDVAHTLEMLSKENPRNRPIFWESSFFKDSIADGEFLHLDFSYFANQLELFLSSSSSSSSSNSSSNYYSNSSSSSDKNKIIEIIEIFVNSMQFQDLSKKLLPLLQDKDLLYFIYHLSTPVPSSSEFASQVLLCECKWSEFEYVLLYNSMANHGKQIRTLIHDRIEKDVRKETLVNLLLAVPSNSTIHHLLLSSSLSLLEKVRISTLATFSIFYSLLSNFNDSSNLKKLIKISRFPFSHISSSSKKTKRKRKRDTISNDDNNVAFQAENKEFGSWKLVTNSNSENANNRNIYSTSDVFVYICSLLYNSLVHAIFQS